jgi:tight adherence protein C
MAVLEISGGVVFGVALPLYWLTGRVRRRQMAIGRELPDALDLIVVSVEAGLSLEAAMSRVAEDPRRLLAGEFRRVLADMNLGMGRRIALRGLATRTRIPALASLVSAIIQADQTGMGIGQVLRAQSAYLRSQRKQRAEEAAMKAPLKMLFPLILFIFPSLFVVILGPAVLSLMNGGLK